METKTENKTNLIKRTPLAEEVKPVVVESVNNAFKDITNIDKRERFERWKNTPMGEMAFKQVSQVGFSEDTIQDALSQKDRNTVPQLFSLAMSGMNLNPEFERLIALERDRIVKQKQEQLLLKKMK